MLRLGSTMPVTNPASSPESCWHMGPRAETELRRLLPSHSLPTSLRSATPCLVLLYSLVLASFPVAAQQAFQHRADAIPTVQQAEAARQANDRPNAIAHYKRSVDLEPEWADGWWFLGYLQYQQDDCASARPSLTRYLALQPNAGPALALRGLCEFQLGDYSAALPDIHLALQNGGANSKHSTETLQFSEAQLLTLSGRYEAALQQYSVLAQDNTLPPPMLAGIALAGLHRASLITSIAEQQRPELVALGSAALLLMRGEAAAGTAAFKTFFTQYPDTPNSHYFEGYLLFTTDPDLAKPEFEHELTISPGNTAAASMLAWAHLQQGRPDLAKPFAKSAAAAEPSNAFAQLVQGRSLAETGDLQQGLDHLETAQQLDPMNLDTHLALATVYSKLGKLAEARAERSRCLELTAREPDEAAQDPHAAQRSSGQP